MRLLLARRKHDVFGCRPGISSDEPEILTNTRLQVLVCLIEGPLLRLFLNTKDTFVPERSSRNYPCTQRIRCNSFGDVRRQGRTLQRIGTVLAMKRLGHLPTGPANELQLS